MALRVRIAVSVFFGAVTLAICLWGAFNVNEGLNLFGLGSDPESLNAFLCAAILSSVTVGVPWIPNLPSRFSLRTLLIATTLLAVLLGLVCYTVR
jgi:hypothetical protein